MADGDSKTQKQAAQPNAALGATAALSDRIGRGLSTLVQRGGGLAGRLSGSGKELSSTALVKQALDARDRGNLPAAFWLLDEAFRVDPDDAAAAAAFWDVAVAYERPADAAQAVAGLIRANVRAGTLELAAQFWSELTLRVPDALADPSSLARILPRLQEEASKETDEELAEQRQQVVLRALRASVDERNEAPTPGTAIHIAELARDLDPASALVAARRALESQDLHEAKRQKLLECIAELDPDAPPPPPPEPEPAPAPSPPPTAAATSQLRPPVDPARNHPLRTRSPRHSALSDDEVARLRDRLPPRRPTSGSEDDELLDPEHEIAPDPTEPLATEPIATEPLDASLEVDPLDTNEEPPLEYGAETSPELDLEMDLGSEPLPPPAAARSEAAPQGEPPEGDSEAPAPVADSLQSPEPGAAEPGTPAPAADASTKQRVVSAAPAAFGDDVLSIDLADSGPTGLPYDRIDAIAVAEVEGLTDRPMLVVDLVAGWRNANGAPPRSVRMTFEDFDAVTAVEGQSGAALSARDVIAELLGRTSAVPLPGPDAAVGFAVPRFASIDDYERDVLELG